ncbi:MAG: hypothetical protein ACLFVO_03290 [Chloroflexaceae bacterium]
MLRLKFQVFFILLFLLLGSVPWLPCAGAQMQPAAPETRTGTTANHTLYLPLVRAGGTPTAGAPTISVFTADPATIAPGAATTLRWNVSGATRLRIEPDIGEVTAPVEVRPAATTTYTLIAGNAAGEARATTSVTVAAVAPEDSRFFAEPEKKTGTPAIAIDPQGGMHLAYRYHVPYAEGPNAIYAYCPPPADTCADTGRWQRLNLEGIVDEVQLLLTSSGKPRLLVTVVPLDNPSERQFIYGECDANCLSQDGWNFANVTFAYGSSVSSVTAVYLPQRYFALDPQDRPRFVFYNADYRVEPDRYGGYYAACDTDCARNDLVATQWTVTKFTQERVVSEYDVKNEQVDFPALTFTRDGRPRIVALLFPLEVLSDDLSHLAYFACDQTCTDAENWQRVKIGERGQGGYPIWDIALDGNDNPRIAFFKAPTSDGTGDQLYYLSCDSDCLNPASWSTTDLGLPNGAGDGVDLLLDSQGRPRMAYLNGENLNYSWCNSGCENAANWQQREVDTTERLVTEYPVPLPVTCDAGVWDTSAPVLALAESGDPHITYEGGYKARCQFQNPEDPNDIRDEFIEIRHTVRVVGFRQP